jgi:hypothetical protein
MIDEEMRTYLLSIPGVAAEITARIYPMPLPQGTTLPAVTYQAISDIQGYSNGNDTCYRLMRYQLDCWSDSQQEAVRVDETIRAALSGHSGQWGAHDIGFVKRSTGSSHYEPETQLRRVRSDYLIHVLS